MTKPMAKIVNAPFRAKKPVALLLTLLLTAQIFTAELPGVDFGAGAEVYAINSETSLNDDAVKKSGIFKYTLLDEYAVICGCDDNTPEYLVIPDKIDNRVVVSISDGAFMNHTTLSSVVLPASLKNIGDCAFYGCENLSEINIPEGIEYIGADAFCGCDKVVLKNGDTTKATDETTVIVDAGEKEPDQSQKDPENTIYKGSQILSSVVIPEQAVKICDNAFEDCHNLETVEMSEGVETIGDAAFKNCDALREINIPTSVTQIADNAFDGCDHVAVKCQKGSYAEKYCIVNKIRYYASGSSNKAIDICGGQETATYEMTMNERKKLPLYLNEEIIKNQNVLYSSSDDNIVSVNRSGVMTARKEGQATVTVKAENGHEDSCTVIVKSLAESIRINSGSFMRNNPHIAIEGPEINFLDKEFKIFSLSANGVNVDMGVVSVDYDAENEKLLIKIGKLHEDKIDPKKDKKAWRAEYQKIKNIYHAATGKNFTQWREYQKFRSKAKKAGFGKIGITAEGTFVGFVELSLANGQTKIDGGGFTGSFDIGADGTINPVAAFPPFYVKIGVGMEGDGTLEVRSHQESAVDPLEPKFDLQYDMNLKGYISGEVGVDISIKTFGDKEIKLLGASGEFIPSVTATIKQTLPKYPEFTAYGQLTLNLKAHALKANWNYDHSWPEFYFYPWGKNEDTGSGGSASGGRFYTQPDRTKNLMSALARSGNSSAFSGAEASQNDVPDNAAPQIVSLGGNRKLSVWISEINGLNTLVYSCFNGMSWSEPKAVADNGIPDGEPAITVAEGGKVFAVWKDEGTGQTDTEMVQSMGINVSYFDGTGFGQAFKVSSGSNSKYLYSPCVAYENGNAFVVWGEKNAENLLSDSACEIRVSRKTADGWSDAELVTGDSDFGCIESALYNGKEYILYTKHDDDHCHYVLLKDGSPTPLTDAAGGYSILHNSLFHYEDESIVSAPLSDVGATTELALSLCSGSHNVLYLTNGNDKAIVWLIDDNGKSEIYISKYDQSAGAWGGGVRATKYDEQIDHFDAVLNADGSVTYAAQLVQTSADSQGNLSYGTSSVVIDSYVPNTDLSVLGAVIDYAGVAPSAAIPAEVCVANEGTYPVNAYTVKAFTSDDVLLGSVNVNESLGSGDLAAVDMSDCHLPASLTGCSVYFTVETQSDSDSSNNRSESYRLDLPDLEIVSATVSADKAKVTVQVKNAGYQASENADVKMYAVSDDGDVAVSSTVSRLSPNAVGSVVLNVDPALLTEDENLYLNIFRISVEPEDDLDYTNNSQTITIESPRAEKVSLDQSSVSLNNETRQVSVAATVYPENAVDKEISWRSSNCRVATVENGVVKAVGNGTAEISAVTVDGDFEAKCDVTVSDFNHDDYNWDVTFSDDILKKVCDGMTSCTGNAIDLSAYGINQSCVSDLVNAVNRKYPLESVAANVSSYSYSYGSDNLIKSIRFIYASADISDKYTTRYNTLKTKAEVQLASLEGKSDYEKILRIHDALALHGEYDMSLSVHDPYTLIVSGTGVCQAYAEGFKMYMDLCGIPCIVVTSTEMNHAWNMVYLGGNWYHIDVTWDDPVPDQKGIVQYKHLLLNDDEIRDLEHYAWSPDMGASSTAYSLMPHGNSTTQYFYQDTWYFYDEDTGTIKSCNRYGENVKSVCTGATGGIAVYDNIVFYGSDRSIQYYSLTTNENKLLYNMPADEGGTLPGNLTSKIALLTVDDDAILSYAYDTWEKVEGEENSYALVVKNGSKTFDLRNLGAETGEVVLQTGKCGDDITYTLYDSGLLELSGSGKMYDYSSYSGELSDKIVPWNNYRNQIKKITFTGNITSVGNYAFCECSSLTSITIPNSVTSIGESAFAYCSKITDVYYAGSEAEWKAISVSTGNDFLLNATIHYNPSVEIPATEITLSDTSLNIQQGGKATLTATVTPNNSTDVIEWSSSDESVATVANGTVTAVNIGIATVTAKAGNVSAMCLIIVGNTPASMTINKETMQLHIGDSESLLLTVVPVSFNSPVWSTSDASVATVENGTVTAVGVGTATVTATIGDKSVTCEVTVTEAAPVSYDVNPNVNGGASKLFEPWGLKYFATFDGDGRAHIADRGIVILKDTYYSDGMTPEAFCSDKNAHVFMGSKGELEFENPTEKYPNGRYAATLTKGIYSYDISAKYYVVPFAVMDNGQTIYGKIKNNSMERILTNNLSSTTVSDTEKAISRCILALKEAVAEYYAEMGIPSASHDMDIPRGNAQTAAPSVKTAAQSGIKPNIVAGAARLIEPWGMRYYATYTASDEIADRGVVMLGQQSYNSVYSSSPDSMRLNKNAFVFRESDGTLVYDSNMARFAATVTDGISSKDIADLYYVVPFVVLNDGSYVYGDVKSNSMKNILTRNQDKDNVPDTEKAVSRDIIALYEAVKAYYEE